MLSHHAIQSCARHGWGGATIPRSLFLAVTGGTGGEALDVDSLLTFLDGGDVPVFIGGALLLVMVVWNRGRVLSAERIAALFRSPEAAQAELDRHLGARVPETATFMASSQSAVPPLLVDHVTRTRSFAKPPPRPTFGPRA
jgi:K+ transporter